MKIIRYMERGYLVTLRQCADRRWMWTVVSTQGDGSADYEFHQRGARCNASFAIGELLAGGNRNAMGIRQGEGTAAANTP